jgi:hypothetical protein
MQLVFEGGNDAKVASAASDAPEQILVLLRASRQHLSVGGYHVGGSQVVTGESIAAVEPAQPTAEGEPRDPGYGDDTERRCQPERLRGAVELSQHEPGLGPDRPLLQINLDGLHSGHVKHDGAVTHRMPSNAVTTTTYRDGEGVSTCELDATDHIGRINRPDHGQRPSINHAVKHSARRVVATIAGVDHLPSQTRRELTMNRTRDLANI